MGCHTYSPISASLSGIGSKLHLIYAGDNAQFLYARGFIQARMTRLESLVSFRPVHILNQRMGRAAETIQRTAKAEKSSCEEGTLLAVSACLSRV